MKKIYKKYIKISQIFVDNKEFLKDNLKKFNWSDEGIKFIVSEYFKIFNEEIHEMEVCQFFRDVSVYENLYELESSLNIVHGEDGSLQYWYICSKCGNLINDDHSAEYQYDCPSLLCPCCNVVKEGAEYPFRIIPRNTTVWIHKVYHFAFYCKKNFLTFNQLWNILFENQNFFKKVKLCLYYFKRVYLMPYKKPKYIAYCNMRWKKLGWRKGK